MSHSQVAPPQSGYGPAAGAAQRPGTLTALMTAAVLSALSAIVGAVLVFFGGHGLAEENLKDVINNHPDVGALPAGTSAADIKSLGPQFWDELVSDRYASLAARGGFAIFTAVCLLAFGLCARNGATWARVLITISGALALFPHFLIFGDYEPTSVTVLSAVALITAVASIVLSWLPANGRYAKERKRAQQAPPPAVPAY